MPDRTIIDDACELTHKAWRVLEEEKNDLGLPNLTIQPLGDFLTAAEKEKLSLADKETILHEAELMLGHFYPHLPFKQDRFGDVNPLEILNQVRDRLAALGETDFHLSILLAFANVRDLHTAYILPSFYQGAIAFLPFQVRFYDQDGTRQFIVTSVMSTVRGGGFEHPHFQPGVELVSWDGEPMENAVSRVAQLRPAANSAALALRGTLRLTLQLPATSGILAWGAPPFHKELISAIEYKENGSTETRAIQFPWGLGTGFGIGSELPGNAFSMSQDSCDTRTAGKVLWQRNHIYQAQQVKAAYGQSAVPAAPAAPDLQHVSIIPDVFEFQYTNGPKQDGFTDPAALASNKKDGAKFGYIRIATFGANLQALDVRKTVLDEFERILRIMNQLAPDGLILDIRGNPGGDILAAERMLQMLTPGTITPARFHLANTPAVVEFLKTVAAGSLPQNTKLDSRHGPPTPQAHHCPAAPG